MWVSEVLEGVRRKSSREYSFLDLRVSVCDLTATDEDLEEVFIPFVELDAVVDVGCLTTTVVNCKSHVCVAMSRVGGGAATTVL